MIIIILLCDSKAKLKLFNNCTYLSNFAILFSGKFFNVVNYLAATTWYISCFESCKFYVTSLMLQSCLYMHVSTLHPIGISIYGPCGDPAHECYHKVYKIRYYCSHGICCAVQGVLRAIILVNSLLTINQSIKFY